MAYRDENEALRARVEELERRLAASEELVARLTGKHPGSRATRKPDSLVGEVVRSIDETTLSGELDAEGLAAMQRVLGERLGLSVTPERGGLRGARTRGAWLAEGGGAGAFSLSLAPGGLAMRLDTDLRRLPVLVALGPMIGVLVSSPLVLWQFYRFHHFESAMSMSVSMPLVALLMVLGTALARGLARRAARRAAEAHAGAWATLLEIARERALVVPRVRAAAVEASDEGGEEEAFERGRVRRGVR